MNRTHNELVRSGAILKALHVGDFAPDFNLPDADANEVALHLLPHTAVIITFYRGPWCRYCDLELRTYQQQLHRIHAAGVALVAISPQLAEKSRCTVDMHKMKHMVLSDVGCKVGTTLGITYAVPLYLARNYERKNADPIDFKGPGEIRLPIRPRSSSTVMGLCDSPASTRTTRSDPPSKTLSRWPRRYDETAMLPTVSASTECLSHVIAAWRRRSRTPTMDGGYRRPHAGGRAPGYGRMATTDRKIVSRYIR
ncbi:peroxiredoxin-like family protein [Mycobacterium paraffinicum]|uniref:peroxiredoxin-like family protein n=1 Tax=Mycobacterium paraffinicum TaxID=53378 RepID=UPI00093B4770